MILSRSPVESNPLTTLSVLLTVIREPTASAANRGSAALMAAAILWAFSVAETTVSKTTRTFSMRRGSPGPQAAPSGMHSSKRDCPPRVGAETSIWTGAGAGAAWDGDASKAPKSADTIAGTRDTALLLFIFDSSMTRQGVGRARSEVDSALSRVALGLSFLLPLTYPAATATKSSPQVGARPNGSNARCIASNCWPMRRWSTTPTFASRATCSSCATW